MAGMLIELRESSMSVGGMLDFRDYLDEKPIHNGDDLLLWCDGHWLRARYELADFATRAVDLHCINGVWQLDRATMRFCWPMEEEG